MPVGTSPLCFLNFQLFFPAIPLKSHVIPKIISIIDGNHEHINLQFNMHTVSM